MASGAEDVQKMERKRKFHYFWGCWAHESGLRIFVWHQKCNFWAHKDGHCWEKRPYSGTKNGISIKPLKNNNNAVRNLVVLV